MATFVNKLTVHGDHETFLAVRNRLTAYMAAQPGYVGHQHLQPSSAKGMSTWRSRPGRTPRPTARPSPLKASSSCWPSSGRW